jgi:hypothetical protein
VNRRASLLALALAAGALALAVVVLLARRGFREAARAAAPPPARPVPPEPGVCKAFEGRYDEAWGAQNHCERDDDCLAERRGELFTGLDRGARYRPRAADTRGADALAAEWLAAGCAREYALAEPAPVAVCREGRCDQRPPANLPASWRRVDVGHAFDLYLPPELVEAKVHPEDSYVRVWRSERLGVSLDYGYYSNQLDDPPDPQHKVGAREQTTIGGQPAFLRVTEIPPRPGRAAQPWTSLGVHFAHVPPSPRSYYSEQAGLSVFVSCAGKPPCPEGELILRSIVFQGGTATRP